MKLIPKIVAPLVITGALAAGAPALADSISVANNPVTHSIVLTSGSMSIDALPQAPILDVPVPQAPKNDWFEKTQAFTKCIFMVGIPIGAAWGIVTNPALMAYVMRMGPLPASSGGTAMKYINTVRNNCGYALR